MSPHSPFRAFFGDASTPVAAAGLSFSSPPVASAASADWRALAFAKQAKACTPTTAVTALSRRRCGLLVVLLLHRAVVRGRSFGVELVGQGLHGFDRLPQAAGVLVINRLPVGQSNVAQFSGFDDSFIDFDDPIQGPLKIDQGVGGISRLRSATLSERR